MTEEQIQQLAKKAFPDLEAGYFETALDENHRKDFNYEQKLKREGFVDAYRKALGNADIQLKTRLAFIFDENYNLEKLEDTIDEYSNWLNGKS